MNTKGGKGCLEPRGDGGYKSTLQVIVIPDNGLCARGRKQQLEISWAL